MTARGAANSLRERTITITYERKQDRNLDIAAGVTIPQTSADGSVRRSHATRHRVSLKLHVIFG